MEEISSLDSFHTDDAESVPRPDSPQPKSDEGHTNTSADDKADVEADAVGDENSKDLVENNDEEDFDQISEGEFEMDENSRANVEQVDDENNDSEENEKQKEQDEEGGAGGNGTEESADFEEVDAQVAGNAHVSGADESDMLGESDMTLPTGQEAAETSNNAMDVDNEEKDGDEEEGNENETSATFEKSQGDEDEAMEGVEEEGGDESVSRDVVDADESKDAEEEAAEDDAPNESTATEDKEGEEEEEEPSEKDKTKTPEGAEQEEHENEPVENVQEPEESDVCLIPDDTENQMTDAEKEQAILARENADKEQEEADAEAAKEKEKEKETSIADAEQQEAESAEQDKTTGEAESANAHADAQAVRAGAEAAAAGSISKETTTRPELEGEGEQTDEPLLEEMAAASGEPGTSKIIIGYTVTSIHKCKQCQQEKLCGYRLKNPETKEIEYVCEAPCNEALLAANPGKYFVRRKKFLVEEVSHDAATGSNDAEGEASVEKQPATSRCMQCREEKACKYFFKVDEETFYICNDICFNLLSVEEPDKFKLKRHSIRVRNIGATIASNTSSTTGRASNESRLVSRTPVEAETARLERVASFTRRCADCFSEIVLGDKNLLWETMDFCNELCLGKYQRTIGAKCETCRGEVLHQALGKYCVRFGFDIRQFCCASCLNEFKKGLKTCSCCQKDISQANEGFLAPVGDKEQFKDFCSQACMRRYDSMCNPKKKLRNDICAVCNNDKPVRVEIMLDDKEHNFCSNPCFSAFKFVSNVVADQCGMCCKYFERKGSESFTIYTERRAKVFCSRICLNVYIIVNRRIVSCQWCKVKKYNFDMIYKQQDSQEILMCSLNCLTLYGVSMNAFSRVVTQCDNCTNTATPQYHLTMSDASMRNFCTYQCVMQFQSQFARTPLTLETDAVQTAEVQHAPSTQQKSIQSSGKNNAPFPTGLPKRVKLKMSQQNQMAPPKTTMPVISTVASLASGETETRIGNVTVRRSRGRGRKIDSPPPLAPMSTPPLAPTSGRGRGRPRIVDYTQQLRSPSPPPLPPAQNPSLPPSAAPQRGANTSKRGVAGNTQPATLSQPSPKAAPPKVAPQKAAPQKVPPVKIPPPQVIVEAETKIIAVPPYPPVVRNVQTSCKPQTVTVGFQCEPTTVDTASQTSKDYSNKVLIPVPVPIYIPQPMYMYSMPFPVPVPIPLPIPVPIFVPTTRNSAQGIMKEIKKIQDKMPADPFEAELLMMAEMVAEEKAASDSDSDDEVKPDPGDMAIEYDNDVQQVEVTNNSYGEDVLQMALKMATGEYDQPTVDLESAMTTNTITNPPPGMVGHDDSMSHMSAHHMQPQHHLMDTPRAGRGRKRAIVSPLTSRAPRSPVKRQRLQELDQSPQQQQTQQQVVEKPDANMCLKYTFGVNAWKQWVMTKNADLEKSTQRRRPFKTELLQMTADELNYSLCLFVREVRKPNGTEYAPDTIYYLVLGIQQYLYENGRIDNIFTDVFYERFTDCLDEVARKFSVLYNDSQYIVTRVEEEHLWECKQLGAHSPHVLLSTLMFFNTKHFNLTTVEEHMQLSFSHIMKHWKRSAQNAKQAGGTRNVLLRFYPPQAGLDANPRKKKVYEQQENEENPLRCPVRLYEFYLSKCPESVKTRNDVFYLQPERSCVPDSPVWYSTQALSQEALQKMLHRVKMVKEINIALLTS